ncbi:phosphodiester glycosidase family protein [Cytobacillus oceanisediminis]|uniref:phosphodiester glycosidase family protein n=1 Tax=Cytobacillus oceanisediminis TaxID=665099 RepID=UPI001D13387F|nr:MULTISPECIES: phosphodiester glycosidase family protein [Cytobacillus]MCC3648519.1 phosphodiester glycosidase family protein [Cytobacillus oceanisediminis]
MNKSLKKAVIPVIASISLSSVLFAGMPANTKSAEQNKVPAVKETLPLGLPSLNESRSTESLAPGVTYTKMIRGEVSEKDYFTVDVDFTETRKQAKDLEKRLISAGFNPRIDRIDRAMDDKEKGPLGYLVRVGEFQNEEDAKDLQQELSGMGYTGLRTVYSGEDPNQATGPWVVNVLEVDPDSFNGSLIPKLGKNKIPGKETLTEMAGRNNALAGINGGYFVVGKKDGTPGDLAGISVMEGKLISEAVNGRSCLILPSASMDDARIASVSSSQTAVSSDGAVREVDGLNRKPGLIRSCGGTGADTPTENPRHDFTCKDGSELIHFTSDFGNQTEAGDGIEAVLNASGDVIELRRQPGGEIPSGGSVLAGTGEAAQWLETLAQAGMKIQVKNEVRADGKQMPFEEAAGIINGGPRLLEEGKISINAAAEGFHQEDNPEFYYRFGEKRHPRTLAGIKADGTLLFVTIDGRAPGISVGVNFEESARIMKSLGAVHALNLDGGGSTSMTVRDTLVTRPSDLTGERPIADAILLLP